MSVEACCFLAGELRIESANIVLAMVELRQLNLSIG
jgi:hypothetical protein